MKTAEQQSSFKNFTIIITTTTTTTIIGIIFLSRSFPEFSRAYTQLHQAAAPSRPKWRSKKTQLLYTGYQCLYVIYPSAKISQ
jgi:hypothetical protein